MGAGPLAPRYPAAPLYVCLHVPEFPAQARLRLRPELEGKPVAVLGGHPPLEQAYSVNAAAQRLGVIRGMTRAELDSFVGVQVLRRSIVEERGAQAVLLNAAGVFTPRVEVWNTATPAFVMVLDMAGSARIFGTALQVVERIRRAAAGLHFFAHITASANFHAAVCVAPSAARSPKILPLGKERECLSRLPLSALNLTAQQAETLVLWGLQTLGELAALPELELIGRLGQEGKRLRLLARGEHPHLMVPEEPVFMLEEFIGFDAPIELLDSLLFVLSPMIDQLITRAQSHCLALASVTVKLGLDGRGEHERTIKPALPLAERDVLLKLLHLDLQAHPPPAGIMSVFVHAEPGDRSKVQLGLFAPQLPEPMRLDVTLARIAALVGEERVGRAKLRDAHRPESFVMERFHVGSPGSAAKEDFAARGSVALRRCRPAIPLFVQRKGQRIGAFWLRGTLYRVQEAYGPWRRSGDWWSNDVWSKEEWDVCGEAGSADRLLCIITHDLLHDDWWLEALYD